MLDFGVARLTGNDVPAVTLRTEAGQLLGTAAYMSPEQASGDPTSVDQRSDVYTLGVILFELLADRLPHDVLRLPVLDALRVIREQDPTRLTDVDRRSPSDVATILDKALERDPARRYPSAGALGEDINRYLRAEPIEARPPSTFYQLRKFARRNRTLVAGVAAVFVALLVGLVVTSVALSREADQRRAAEASLLRANASSDFLERVLLALSPAATEGRDTELVEAMLEEANDAVEQIPHDEVRGEMLIVVAQAYASISKADTAITLLERAIGVLEPAVGPLHEQVLEARQRLGESLEVAGRFEEAESVFRRLVDDAKQLSDERRASRAWLEWSELKIAQEQPEEALEFLGVALSLDAPVETSRVELLRGAALRRLGRFDDARSAYELALQHAIETDHTTRQAIAMNSLAVVSRRQGDNASAERYYRDAIRLREEMDARPNPTIASMLSNLARLLLGVPGKEAAALEIANRSVAMHQEVFPGDHYGTAISLLTRSDAARQNGDTIGARDDAMAARDMAARTVGTEHGAYVAASLELARACITLEDGVQAESLARAGLDDCERLGAQGDAFVGGFLEALAESLVLQNQTDEAIATLERAVQAYEGREAAQAAVRERIEAIRSGGQG